MTTSGCSDHIESLHGPWPWATQATYAQAVRVGELVLTGGIGPYDDFGNVVPGDFEAQVRQAFCNLEVVLNELDAGLDNIASMQVYVSESALYPRFTAIRPELLSAPFPASTAVGATLLGLGMQIEVSAIAIRGLTRAPRRVND